MVFPISFSKWFYAIPSNAGPYKRQSQKQRRLKADVIRADKVIEDEEDA